MSFPGYSGPGAPSIFSSSTFMPAFFIAGSAIMKSMGINAQAKAAVTAAGRNQQAARYAQAEAGNVANNVQGAAQRDAYFKGLEGDLAISALKARAGSGAGDPSTLGLIAALSERKAYNMQALMYGGKDKARSIKEQAKANVYQADLARADAEGGRNAARFASIGALASGGASIYEKYWPKDKMDGIGGGMGWMNNDPGDPYDLQFGEA